MDSMKSEELMIEAKFFFSSYKKAIGNSIRKGKKILFVDFKDLLSISPTLAEGLMSNPEEIIQLLETALEETGLIKNPQILIKDLPESNKRTVSNIELDDLNGLISIKGRIIHRDKIRHKVKRVKYECPTCGTVISVLQIGNKIKEPSKCSCGRKADFRTISKILDKALKITIQDERTDDTIESEFNGEQIKEFGEELYENNIVEIVGVPKDKILPNSVEIIFELTPYGFELITSSNTQGNDTYEYLDALMKLGNKGAYIFEEFVGKLFEKKGYRVTVTKKSGDYGIDVIAEKDNEKIAIQCKLVNENVKIPNKSIQNALGSLVSPYNANKLIFVATANEYTANAIKQAENSTVPVELWNKTKLISEIKSYMEDSEEGWELLNEPEEESISDVVPFDIERFTTKVSSENRTNTLFVRDIIKKLSKSYGKQVPIEAIRKEIEVENRNLDFEAILNLLKKSGEVYQPKSGFVQLV